MRIRTGYSFKHAVGKLDEVLDRLVEIGWQIAPISDRESTFAFAKWTKLAKDKGLRPIYGCELPVLVDDMGKKPVYDFWTFFAKDDIADMHEAVWQATGGVERFDYYKALSLPGVVRILSKTTRLDLLEVPPDDTYLPLSPSTPRALFRAGRDKKFKFIACSDNVYTRRDDLEFYRLLLGPMRASTQTFPQHILSDEELRQSVSFVSDSEFADALVNRSSAVASCRAELHKAEIYIPKKTKTLKELCDEGAKARNVDTTDPVYAARLEHELSVIAEKKFEDYFYIIADAMQWARKRMVVGPARGSSCGSLVCYLLGITSVDPIKYDLIFERFIDTTRADLPDIDIDLSDTNRHYVFEYIDRTYGKKHVARLGSVNMFKARMALNTASVGLQIPKWQTNELLNVMAKHAAGDERAGQLIADAFNRTEAGQQMLKEYPNATVAARLEGHPFAAGQHAAGVILTRDRINKYVAVDARTGATMCDKRDAETLNLLKIDVLGLTQLSIFERTLELIGEKPISDFLEKIPMDDQSAYDVLNEGRFSGIFQFAPRSTLARLVEDMTHRYGGRLDNIEDLVALTSLVRPGPLNSGAAETWIRRRCGKEAATSPHKLLEPILHKTQGILVYQEQIMRIGREVGDLSWDEVTALRKAMGKSLGAEYFNRWGIKWKEGAVAKGMTVEQADRLWSDMCGFGAYAFNRSHAVAYGIVSYWCCWLKAHYPVEFAAATLDSFKEQSDQVIALREMRDEGIDYVPVDTQHSTLQWNLKEDGDRKILVGPLTNIRGVGPEKAKQIIKAREEDDTEKLARLLKNTRTNIGTLSPIRDRVKELVPDFTAAKILSTPTDINDIQTTGREYEALVLGKVTKIMLVDDNDPKAIERRGGVRLRGATDVLKLRVADDSGEITCRISRFDFPKLGKPTLEQAKANKSLFAIKGVVPKQFRMIQVKKIKYLGEMESDKKEGK